MKNIKKKLLIVDDKRETRALVRSTLEYEGWEIIEAENGELATKAALEHKPDIVIMDMIMPGKLNGIDTSRAILANEETAQCEIVMLTGSDAELRRHALEAGISEYIQKPFSPLDLIEKVNALFHKKQEAQNE